MCGGGGVWQSNAETKLATGAASIFPRCQNIRSRVKQQLAAVTSSAACHDVTADSCTDVTRTFVGHAAGVEIVLGGGAQRLQVLGLERHDAQEVVAVLQRHASSRHIEHSQGTFW